MCCGATPYLATTPAASRIWLPRRSTCTTRSPWTHCARSLSGVQMQTLSHLGIGGRERCGRGQGVVRLQLDHRPDRHAHRRQRLLERMELRLQRGVDAGAGLVAGPQIVAERLDHVVGGDADMRRAALQHLGDRAQHALDRAQRRVGAGCAAGAVELAEQLVGAVDQVDDHSALTSASSDARAGRAPGPDTRARRPPARAARPRSPTPPAPAAAVFARA